MFGSCQPIAPNDEARSEIDKQGDRFATAIDETWQRGAEKIGTRCSGTLHRRESQVTEQRFVGGWIGVGPCQHPKTCHRIPTQYLVVPGLKQGVSQAQVEGLWRDHSGRNLAGLQVADVSRQDELALERQETQEIPEPSRLLERR